MAKTQVIHLTELCILFRNSKLKLDFEFQPHFHILNLDFLFLNFSQLVHPLSKNYTIFGPG